MLKNGVPILDASTLRTITILGRAGESLRSIQRATGIRRERISKILKGQGIRVRFPRFRRLPALAVVATSPVTGRDEKRIELPADAGTSVGAKGSTPFNWDCPQLPPAVEEQQLPAKALRWALPTRLDVVQVRVLRDHLAQEHDLEDAAKRMGIDPWVGREVQDVVALILVACEIRDRLYFLESRRRR